MNPWITNTKLLITGLFFVAALGTIGYEWRYVWPVKQCEEKGAWWDPQDRQCLAPIAIGAITGRVGGPTSPETKPNTGRP